jgi:hypothetical protein
MTYFKYVKRNADSQTDWSAVSKNISDTLIKTRDEREAKRQDIEERSRQFGIELDTIAQGENPEFGQFTLDMAEQTKELRRIQDNLLRSGLLKVRDYNMNRQALNDDWDNFVTMSEEYNTEYSEKLKLYQEGKLSQQTLDEMSQIEGFANFTETKGVVDHMSSRLFLSKKKRNKAGEITEELDPASSISINEMRNRLKRKVDRVDPVQELTPIMESLGQQIEVMRRSGILTEENILLRDLNPADEEVVSTFRRAQENAINSILSSPDKVSSVLVDVVGRIDGKPVDFVYARTDDDAAKLKEQNAGNPHILVLKRDPKSGNYFADATEAQREIAFNALRDQSDVMLDIKEAPEPIDFEARREATGRAAGKEAKEKAVTSIAQLWYGDDREVAESVRSLLNNKSARGSITSISRDPEEGVTIFYGEDEKQTFPFKVNETLLSQEEFAKSIASFFGIEDIDEALALSSFKPNAEFGRGKGTAQATQPIPAFNDQNALVDGEPVKVSDLFNDVRGVNNVFGGYTINSNSRQAIGSVVSNALSGLPKGVKSNMISSVQDYDGDDLVAIYLPQVMDKPLYIPAGEDVGNEMQNALRFIYETAAKGERLTRSDFSGIGITDFAEFNKDKVDKETGVGVQGSTNEIGGRVR